MGREDLRKGGRLNLTPQAKVKILLRTLHEARDGLDHDGPGEGGALLMPSIYSFYSYPELEIQLARMREEVRQLWWHTCYRYRFGAVRWGKVNIRRRHGNPTYRLPPRSELIAVGLHHGSWAQARLYQWSELVNEDTAEAGVDWLIGAMYDGDSSRIWVPDVFLAAA